MSKFIPNSFQIPNSVIDELLAKLTCAELKCYLYVVRKTRGWNKDYDSISVNQFMDVTGLSNRSVITACESLVQMGLLERFGGERKRNTYSVKAFHLDETGEKSSSEQSGEVFSKTGEKSSSDLVKKVHTQNNNKNTIQNNNKKTSQKKSQSAVEILASFGIEGQLAKDFISHRKTKRAAITQTALERLQKQADLAKLPLQEVVAMMIERGWQGFQANWDWKATENPKKKFSDDDDSWWRNKTIEIRGY